MLVDVSVFFNVTTHWQTIFVGLLTNNMWVIPGPCLNVVWD